MCITLTNGSQCTLGDTWSLSLVVRLEAKEVVQSGSEYRQCLEVIFLEGGHFTFFRQGMTCLPGSSEGLLLLPREAWQNVGVQGP